MRIKLIKVLSLSAGIALMGVAGQASAQCGSGCLPPPPPTPPTQPPPPGMPHGGSNFHSNATANATATATATVNVNSGARSSIIGSYNGSAYATGGSYGGGYSNWSQTPMPPESMGLNVQSGGGQMSSSQMSSRSVTRTMALQASCIDDKGVPHPASQVSPERGISAGYVGEVYRCIAGTRMQVTMVGYGSGLSQMSRDCFVGGRRAGGRSMSYGNTSQSSYGSAYQTQSDDAAYSQASDYSQDSAYSNDDNANLAYGQMDGGYSSSRSSSQQNAQHQVMSCETTGGHMSGDDMQNINFTGGQTLSCGKGQALWFERGNVTCRTQVRARACNERSLLRRFGTGIKILTLTTIETYRHQSQMSASGHTAGCACGTMTNMVFNGGVGGYVQ